MSSKIIYRKIIAGDEVAVCNLVARSFNEFIAPGFSEEGVEEFYRYVNPRALHRRWRTGYHVILAEYEGNIAGVVEVKKRRHISMLYVEKAYHRKGIASELLNQALDYILSRSPKTKEVTVNSSPYAVPFYERAGFRKTDEEKVIHGIVHVPMSLILSEEEAVNS
jgi:GNAT superfamily N-acetyltransferase